MKNLDAKIINSNDEEIVAHRYLLNDGRRCTAFYKCGNKDIAETLTKFLNSINSERFDMTRIPLPLLQEIVNNPNQEIFIYETEGGNIIAAKKVDWFKKEDPITHNIKVSYDFIINPQDNMTKNEQDEFFKLEMVKI